MSWFNPENPLVDLLKDQNERLKAETKWLQQRVETLTNQVLSMKRDGFQWTPPLEKTERGPQMDERIMVAIRSRAKEGSTLERELFEYAQGLLILNGEIEDVVDQILAGAQVD